MVQDTIITFVKESEDLSLAKIESLRKHKGLHIEDTKLNLLQGELLKTDHSSIKLTVKPESLERLFASHGYSEKDLHQLPTDDKSYLVLTVFRGLKQVLAKNFNVPLKGIVFHVDEDLPHGHIFFEQQKQDNNTTATISPLADSTNKGHHQQEKKQPKNPQKSKSLAQHQQQRIQQEHLRFIQYQNATQQAKAIEEEKKKFLQRNKRQAQHRRSRQQLRLRHQNDEPEL